MFTGHKTIENRLPILILLIGLFTSGGLVRAQSKVPRVQQFSWVYYQYPVQYFSNGAKSGLDINIKDKWVLGLQYQNTLAYNTVFFDPPGSQSSTDVNILPNYKMESNFKVLAKNYIGGYAQSFHGAYIGVFAEIGRGNESYYKQLAPGFPKTLITNNYQHQRLGFLIGRQWTLFNEGVLDFNMGLGFNSLSEGDRVDFTAVPPLGIGENSAYFVSNLGFGIGKRSVDQTLPRKPRLSDSLALHDAFLLDLNAIINSGIEFNVYFRNWKKHMWRTYARYRNTTNTILRATQADSSVSFMLGLQYRHYPTASLFRNGMYVGTGLSGEYAKNRFTDGFWENGVWRTTRSYESYFPINWDVTLGFTTILDHRYIIEAYLSNILTLSGKKINDGEYGRINEATGMRTELGVKFGFARFRRK